MGGRTAKASAALIAVLVLGASVAGGAVKLPTEGTLHAKPNVRLAPHVLAKKGQTPIALRTSSRFWIEGDGSRLPPLREYRMQLDRLVRLSLGGVPVCGGGVRSQVRGGGLPERCRNSIVGQGRIKVDVEFPETTPIVVEGKGSIYRGPVREGSGPMLYLHLNFGPPITGEVIVSIELKRIDSGRYGLEAVASFPKIGGGAGSTTHLAVWFRRGIFTASCPPDRRLQTGHSALFADGTRWVGATTGSCAS